MSAIFVILGPILPSSRETFLKEKFGLNNRILGHSFPYDRIIKVTVVSFYKKKKKKKKKIIQTSLYCFSFEMYIHHVDTILHDYIFAFFTIYVN